MNHTIDSCLLLARGVNQRAVDFDGEAFLTSASKQAITKANGVDQFYTKPAVAKKCWQEFLRIANRLNLDVSRYWFVEPSAGCGCFYQILPPRRRIGIDIAPRRLPKINGDGIECADYLEWQPNTTDGRQRKYVVIGNPPFGKRGQLAVQFFNHSGFADFIAFIVPVSFRKHFIHRHLSTAYSLITRMPLHKDSFCTPDGKHYAVNAEFQVWTRLSHSLQDMRETCPAPIRHLDFEMRQYNNTEAALKMFDAPFDFAVPCQGYQDYSRRETSVVKCEKHKQWILFVAKNKKVLAKLKRLDYHALAHYCTTATPGFRKNDVVRYYDTLV